MQDLFLSDPKACHWNAAKRIMRYLQGTVDFGICYIRDGESDVMGFSDADWAGDLADRKSTSGYIFMYGGGPVSWRSQKQGCVALSSAEAEYVALAAACQEAVWQRQLFNTLKMSPAPGPNVKSQDVEMNTDSQSAMAIAKNPRFHGRAKHIDIKYHYVRDSVQAGKIKLVYCPTDDMVADILTKPLAADKHCKLRTMMNVCKI